MSGHSRFDVFISHNGKEKTLALEFSGKLRDRGLRVWLDVWELRPGLSWQQGMLEGLAASDSCAVLIGSSGYGGWHRREIEVALQQQGRDYPVIPVLLPGSPDREEIDAFLASLTWVDFRQGIEDPDALDRVVWGITGRRPSHPGATKLAENQRSLATWQKRFHIETPRDGDLLAESPVIAGAGPPNERVFLHYRAPGKSFQIMPLGGIDESGRWENTLAWALNSPGPYEIYVAGKQAHLPSQPVTVYNQDTSNVHKVADKVRRSFRKIELSYEVRTAFLETTRLQSGQPIASGKVDGPVQDVEQLARKAGENVAVILRNMVVGDRLQVTVWIDAAGRIRIQPATAWASYYAFPVNAESRMFGYPPSSDPRSLFAMRQTQMAWRIFSNVGHVPQKPFGDDFKAKSTYLEIRHDGYRPEFVPLDNGTSQSFTVELTPVLQKRVAVLNFPSLYAEVQIDGYSQLIAKEIASAIEGAPELATFGCFSSSPPNKEDPADFFEQLGRPQIQVVNEVLTLRDVRAVETKLEAIDNPMVSGEGRFVQRKMLDIQLMVRGSYRLLH